MCRIGQHSENLKNISASLQQKAKMKRRKKQKQKEEKNKNGNWLLSKIEGCYL